MVAVAGEAIDNRTHNEMSPKLLGQTIEFVNIALLVADMNAALGAREQVSRLTQVPQPADAFLPLDGDARRVDFLLSCAVPLNFSRFQNLTAVIPTGSPS